MPINIASLIKPASVISEHLKICIYGDYSCGKTTLAVGAPRPLLVDTERGSTVLVKNDSLKNTPTIRIRTLPEFVELFDFLKSSAGNAYDTLIIDTLSELQKQFLDSIISDSAQSNKNMDQFTIPDNGYNRNNQFLRYFLANLLELPKHVILTCHADTKAVNGIDRRMPLLTPKVLEGVMGLMDVVGYMSISEMADPDSPKPGAKKKIRKIQTLQTLAIEAKNRLDVPDVMENPSIQIFLDAHNKRIEQAKQPQTAPQLTATATEPTSKGLRV